MKKINLILVLISILALCTLTLVSCGDQLGTPSGFVLDEESLTLSWTKVDGARFYTVEITGAEKPITTKKTELSLDDLEPGNYEIKVQANGDGESVDDSDFAVYNFTREYETGLKYQLINNETEYQLIGGGTASGDVVMESTYRGKPVTAIADKALYNNGKITSFTVGANVKTIGLKAFARASKLSSITIPEGVVSIGENAFQNCKLLTAITLPDSVTVINPYTFSGCETLASIKLGNRVTTISEQSFAKCQLLNSITYNGAPADYKASLPNTVQYIGPYAFNGCKALTDMNVGNGTQVIDTYAFAGCAAMTKVNLGASLKTVVDYAFSGCTALSSVAFPDSTESIAMAAFFECASLAEVDFGAGLKSLGNGALAGTKLYNDAIANEVAVLTVDGWIVKVFDANIEKYNVSNDVVGIGDYAFNGCEKLLSVDFKGVKYVGYGSFAFSSVNYANFDNSLLDIAASAFAGCKYLRLIQLGNSITSIGSYAFNDCASLEEVTIPSSVTTIGTRAFRGTAKYNELNLPLMATGKVVYVGGWAVDYIPRTNASIFNPEELIKLEPGTRGIANYTFNNQIILVVNLPDSIEYIGRGAFNKCMTTSLNLPKNLKYIGDYAFYNCNYTNFGKSNDYALVIPEGTQYIGRSAFYGCTNVVSLTVPGSVEYIGPYAFYDCVNMGGTFKIEYKTGEVDADGHPITDTVIVEGFISLGNGIKYIGDRAFQGCNALVSVTVPDSVTYLGTRAFYKCAGIKELTLGSGITSIPDYTFYKCEALEKVVVSDKLEAIGNYAFRGCISLKQFDLMSVKSIGRYSFYGCTAFTSIVLPDTLVSVGDYAFRGCNAATSIIIPSSVATIGKHVFYKLDSTTLYCESETVMPYWDSKYNSSYRPVFWGCTLSEDGKYVVSFTKTENSLVNWKATNGISNPVRDGYIFAGWATEQGSKTVAYTSETVSEAANGTVLYAIWVQQGIVN